MKQENLSVEIVRASKDKLTRLKVHTGDFMRGLIYFYPTVSDLLNESFCNMNEKMSDKLRLQDNVLILQKMCKPIHNFIDFCFIEKHDQKHQICALFTKLQEILFFYVAI